MIRINVNFGPFIGRDVIGFGLVRFWNVTTYCQKRSFNICQSGFIMSIFRVCMIVENKAIITTGECNKCNECLK